MADTMQEKMLKLMGFDMDKMAEAFDLVKGVQDTLSRIEKKVSDIETYLQSAPKSTFIPAEISDVLEPGVDADGAEILRDPSNVTHSNDFDETAEKTA